MGGYSIVNIESELISSLRVILSRPIFKSAVSNRFEEEFKALRVLSNVDLLIPIVLNGPFTHSGE